MIIDLYIEMSIGIDIGCAHILSLSLCENARTENRIRQADQKKTRFYFAFLQNVITLLALPFNINQTLGYIMKTLNELFLLCRRESATIADIARKTGLDYYRVYRLTRAPKLADVITLRELHAITDAYPNFLINY